MNHQPTEYSGCTCPCHQEDYFCEECCEGNYGEVVEAALSHQRKEIREKVEERLNRWKDIAKEDGPIDYTASNIVTALTDILELLKEGEIDD